MSKYDMIRHQFEEGANSVRAVSMKAYMKDHFDFYGIDAATRKSLYKDFIRQEKKNKRIDWGFLDECYKDEHREFQYLVYDYLLALKKYVVFEDIVHIRGYIEEKSWWDTIDFLCKVIGSIDDQRVAPLMIKWSQEENIWMRRSAIEYQLGLKAKTNTEVLETILINSFGTKEFFINKAIGWALRDYSKVNPLWVSSFIEKHKDQMSSLSIKEASKYI